LRAKAEGVAIRTTTRIAINVRISPLPLAFRSLLAAVQGELGAFDKKRAL
jgi:hypothetical protein